jgi:hemerythrin
MVGTDSEKPITPEDNRIQQEHDQIRVILHTIESTESIDAAASLLREHLSMISRHFAREEETGGLYDTILEEAPHHERRLATLRAQHGELLAKITTLLRDVENDESSTDHLDRARSIAKMIVAHETEEGSLLLEVFNTDIGVGD